MRPRSQTGFAALASTTYVATIAHVAPTSVHNFIRPWNAAQQIAHRGAGASAIGGPSVTRTAAVITGTGWRVRYPRVR
jgi:hypothetical protein